MQVITSVIDSGDGVFIGGKHLHNTFKPMTNTELTLDQLTAIAGGATAIEYGLIAALHSIPTDNLRVNDSQLKGSNLRVNDNQ